MEPHRQRPRSNTTSFAAFHWRRKPDVHALPQPASQQLPLEDLIKALSPPAVPSLAHARSLAAVLATQSPLPPPHILNPILTSLCAANCPISLQCAGYDILSAYWENNDANLLSTSDRLTYFSLFLGPTALLWSHELWETRFKALRTLTKWGAEVLGMENQFIDVLKSWLQGAFDGLIAGNDVVENAERERSVDLIASLLSSVVENNDVASRLPDNELSSILQFYSGLVDRAMDVPHNSPIRDNPATAPPQIVDPPNTPTRPTHTHRRHPSSLSVASSTPRPITPPPKHPADIAIALYLAHLSTRLKSLSPDLLTSILPLLFRTLAFYASPLPRLTVIARSRSTSAPEERITETLDSLFSGPYSTSCMNILKHHLSPSNSLSSLITTQTSIQISIGAHRTLRNYIRKGLCTRLARAYISRESSLGYSHSGAPGHMDVERELMERAWPKDDVSGWDAGRLGPALHRSVEAWVMYEFARDNVVGHLRERILDEAAGTLKDVLQELDSREGNIVLEEEEACAVGETLRQLAMYILPLRFVPSTHELNLQLIVSKKPRQHTVHYSAC